MKLVLAFKKHALFGITFILVLSWLTLSHNPGILLEERLAIKALLGSTGLVHQGSFAEYRDLIHGSMVRLMNPGSKRRTVATMIATKHALSSCPDANLFTAGVVIERPDETLYCLSEGDISFLAGACTSNNTCSRICASPSLEPSPLNCTIQNVADSSISLVLEQPFLLRWSPLLDSIQITLLVERGNEIVSIVETSWHEADASVNISVFVAGQNLVIPLMFVCIAFSGVMLVLDVKQVEFGSLMASLTLPTIIGLRWWFVGYQTPSVFSQPRTSHAETITFIQSVLNLERLRKITNCCIFVMNLLAASRVIVVLSAHPRTAVLYETVKGKRVEICKLLLSFSLVVVLFTAAWSRSPEWLIQVPFGVWPFQNRDSTIFLVAFGLLGYHFLVVLFQVIVNAGFREFRLKTKHLVSYHLHTDIWYLVKRSVTCRGSVSDLLTLLDTLESRRCIPVSAESKKLWDFYVVHFGDALIPDSRDDDSFQLPVEDDTSSEPAESYPPIEAVRKCLDELNEF